MRCWIAWIAGVRMVMSGVCACAGAMPSRIHGSNARPRPVAPSSSAIPPGMPPGSSAGTSGAVPPPSSPITFSTNSRAASRASAAGKYTLMVTQAVSASAATKGSPVQRMQSSSDGQSNTGETSPDPAAATRSTRVSQSTRRL